MKMESMMSTMLGKYLSPSSKHLPTLLHSQTQSLSAIVLSEHKDDIMRTEISRLKCSKGELANLSSCTSKIQVWLFYLGLCAEKQVNNVHQTSIHDINLTTRTWMLKAGQKT